MYICTYMYMIRTDARIITNFPACIDPHTPTTQKLV